MSENPELNSKPTATSQSYAQRTEVLNLELDARDKYGDPLDRDQVLEVIRRLRDAEVKCEHLEKMAFQWQAAAQDVQANASTRIAHLELALEQIADLAEQGEHTGGAAPIARAALEKRP